MPPRGLCFLACLICLGGAVSAQPLGSHRPAPLSIHVPLAAAWKGMHKTLDMKRHEVAQEDISKGLILTRSEEYTSGPLATSHIRKISAQSKLMDGDWVRAEYQYEIHIQYESENSTLVWVDARIRGLKRPFIGSNEWVTLNSTGKLEEELLTLFGRHLFGHSFALDRPGPGFWERKPGYVRKSFEVPRTIGPERQPGL